MSEHQMKIRVPIPLKEWIDEQSRENRRSMNAEIVFRLEQCRAAGTKASADAGP
jgi:hypothetical protein